MHLHGVSPCVEGRSNNGWIALDTGDSFCIFMDDQSKILILGDIITHIMIPDAAAYYNIEGRWNGAHVCRMIRKITEFDIKLGGEYFSISPRGSRGSE